MASIVAKDAADVAEGRQLRDSEGRGSLPGPNGRVFMDRSAEGPSEEELERVGAVSVSPRPTFLIRKTYMIDLAKSGEICCKVGSVNGRLARLLCRLSPALWPLLCLLPDVFCDICSV